MKIRFINKELNIAELEQLVEKYYDGLTTANDEKRLYKLLSNSKLPKQFEPDRAILNYFDKKKVKHTRVIPLQYGRYAAVAAVALIAFISVNSLYSNNKESYAYINGKKITDTETIRSQALASLEVISSSPDEVQESVKNLNTHELIQQQLDVFSQLP